MDMDHLMGKSAVCVCVCESVRKREREGEKDREGKRERSILIFVCLVSVSDTVHLKHVLEEQHTNVTSALCAPSDSKKHTTSDTRSLTLANVRF